MKRFSIIILLIFIYAVVQAQAITDSATLRQYINTNIITNNTRAITGTQLNVILNGVLNVMNTSGGSAGDDCDNTIPFADTSSFDNPDPGQITLQPSDLQYYGYTSERWICLSCLPPTDTLVNGANEHIVKEYRSDPPASPNMGDSILVLAPGSGAFTSHDNKIMGWNGTSWNPTIALENDYAYISNNFRTYQYLDGQWVIISGTPLKQYGNNVLNYLIAGTNGNHPFYLETNNINRVGISTTGKIQLINYNGTDTADVQLDESGNLFRNELAQVSDTNLYKIVVTNDNGKKFKFSHWPSSGSEIDTLRFGKLGEDDNTEDDRFMHFHGGYAGFGFDSARSVYMHSYFDDGNPNSVLYMGYDGGLGAKRASFRLDDESIEAGIVGNQINLVAGSRQLFIANSAISIVTDDQSGNTPQYILGVHDDTEVSLYSLPDLGAGGEDLDATLTIGNTTSTDIISSADITANNYIGTWAGDQITNSQIASLAWIKLTGTPTTLAGFGIIDAAAISHTHAATDITSGTLNDARLSNNVVTTTGNQVLTNKSGNISQWTNDANYLTGNQNITLSGDLSGTGSTTITTTIGANKVLNSMLAGSIAASKLIGSDITLSESQVTNLTTDLAAKEDVSNKSTTTSLGTSNTLYPTQNAVKTYADTKQPLDGTITAFAGLTTAVDKVVTTTGVDAFSSADFKMTSRQTYGGSDPVFTSGTGPSTITSKSYRWQQVGNIVYYNFVFIYSSPGSGNLAVVWAKPSDMPNPEEPTGLGAASEWLQFGSGGVSTNNQYIVNNSIPAITVNSGDTGYDFSIKMPSAASKVINISGWYFVP